MTRKLVTFGVFFFLLIALAIAVAGVSIAHFQETQVLVDTPYETTIGWFEIERLRTNFFTMFQEIDEGLSEFTLQVPLIPDDLPKIIVPYGLTNDWITAIINQANMWISVVSGIVRILNILINVGNAIVVTIRTIFSFITSIIAFIGTTIEVYTG